MTKNETDRISPAMIGVENVSKQFMLGQTFVHALVDVCLEISKGEFVAIAGPSGSGKSTLLNLIGCIEAPSRGSITFDGAKINEFTANQAASLRLEKMGFIFQTFNLLPVFTAYENVEYPLVLRQIPPDQRRERVMACLRDVGMDPYASHKPSQLSGGQRQRVAIARALVGAPSIILADEPTANLDQKTAKDIVALLKAVHQAQNVTVIFSTHDPHIISQADTIIRLESGRRVS